MAHRGFAYLRTALKFTANLSTTGALFQTSKKAVEEVTKHIDTSQKQIIVEYGAGHGNVTQRILDKMHPDSKLYAFEINNDFCKTLSLIKDDRLIIINGSAEKIEDHIKEPVDCIISTLPFSLIPKNKLTEILENSYEKLKKNGSMSQILYSTFHLNKYRRFFGQVSFASIFGIPIEFVYHCEK